MSQIFISSILYGSVAILLTVISGAIPLLKRWQDYHLHRFVCFSAGILIATAFLYLLPEAILLTDSKWIGFFILGSFVTLYILEKFVMLHPCEEVHCDYHNVGIAAYVGMCVHTLFDGLALGSTFFVEGLDWIVFLAIMAHKIPASFSLATILKKAEWKNRQILFFIFIFGSIIPLGAFISSSVLSYLSAPIIGMALSLSLGTFLYIATSDFLPQVHRAGENRLGSLLSFLLGIGVMVVLSIILSQAHLPHLEHGSLLN